MAADALAADDLLPGFTIRRFKTAGAEINAAVGGDGPAPRLPSQFAVASGLWPDRMCCPSAKPVRCRGDILAPFNPPREAPSPTPNPQLAVCVSTAMKQNRPPRMPCRTGARCVDPPPSSRRNVARPKRRWTDRDQSPLQERQPDLHGAGSASHRVDCRAQGQPIWWKPQGGRRGRDGNRKPRECRGISSVPDGHLVTVHPGTSAIRAAANDAGGQ